MTRKNRLISFVKIYVVCLKKLSSLKDKDSNTKDRDKVCYAI